MKKMILKGCIVLYAILYSASLLYIGYEYGEASLLPYPRGPEYFLLPIVQLALLLKAIWLLAEIEYNNSKKYVVIATATIVYGCLFGGGGLLNYFGGNMSNPNMWDAMYYAVLLILSIVIAILFYVAARNTRKD